MPYELYYKEGGVWKKVAGTYPKVEPKTDRVEGATDLKALTIDGTDYNMPASASGDCLPLAGGKMDVDATIKFQSTGVSVSMDDDTKRLTICGGTDIGHGGQLMLYGKDAPYADTKGGFRMAAVGNDGSAPLLGMPDGTLTWGNTLKFVSGDNGLVAMTKNTNKLLLAGGEGISSSASMQLYGIDYGDSDAGAFQITACTSTSNIHFVGKPNGTLKWGGNDVLTSASLPIVKVQIMDAGPYDLNGGYMWRYLITSPTVSGYTFIGAMGCTVENWGDFFGSVAKDPGSTFAILSLYNKSGETKNSGAIKIPLLYVKNGFCG